MLDEAQAVIHGWRQWQVAASKPVKPLPPFTPSKVFPQTSPGRHLSDISLKVMAPVEPSFIMFSVKPQGSEAVSVRVVACSVGSLRICHLWEIYNFPSESPRHGWTRQQERPICQGGGIRIYLYQ